MANENIRIIKQEPCYSCIGSVDLALHKPSSETEFVHYKAYHPTEKGGGEE